MHQYLLNSLTLGEDKIKLLSGFWRMLLIQKKKIRNDCKEFDWIECSGVECKILLSMM